MSSPCRVQEQELLNILMAPTLNLQVLTVTFIDSSVPAVPTATAAPFAVTVLGSEFTDVVVDAAALRALKRSTLPCSPVCYAEITAGRARVNARSADARACEKTPWCMANDHTPHEHRSFHHSMHVDGVRDPVEDHIRPHVVQDEMAP